MCSPVLFAKYKCSYQRTWQHRDAAWVRCCCPSFHVWGDLYMHSVITEAQCVTNEKFNETLSMDQRPGPRPQTDYEISYFLSQHGAFFIIAQYECLRNPLLSWAPQLGHRVETQQHNSGWSQKETLQINVSEYTSVSRHTAVVLVILSGIFSIFTRIHL